MARCIRCILSFVNDLYQVDGFLQVFRLSPPIKPTSVDITEILLKVVLNNRNTISISSIQDLSIRIKLHLKEGIVKISLQFEDASHLIKEHITFSKYTSF